MAHLVHGKLRRQVSSVPRDTTFLRPVSGADTGGTTSTSIPFSEISSRPIHRDAGCRRLRRRQVSELVIEEVGGDCVGLRDRLRVCLQRQITSDRRRWTGLVLSLLPGQRQRFVIGNREGRPRPQRLLLQ
jgi:hypothetical protein